MPGFVTKMFALPKMKKYPFKLALDYEGHITKDWPKKMAHVTFIKLSSLKIVEVKFLKNDTEIEANLKNIIQ